MKPSSLVKVSFKEAKVTVFLLSSFHVRRNKLLDLDAALLVCSENNNIKKKQHDEDKEVELQTISYKQTQVHSAATQASTA